MNHVYTVKNTLTHYALPAALTHTCGKVESCMLARGALVKPWLPLVGADATTQVRGGSTALDVASSEVSSGGNVGIR